MKDPWKIKDEAQAEAYEFFDKKVRPLLKDNSGNVDPSAHGLVDNDADAFRHAYVSAVFTQEYGENAARVFGNVNEMDPLSLYSRTSNPGAFNMDLWNNRVGRKYGKKTKNRKTLLKMILKALKNGELITDPADKRKFQGSSNFPSEKKPLVVVGQTRTGRNILFYDLILKTFFEVSEIVSRIDEGKYPGYSVKWIHGFATPVSKRDAMATNNLG